MNILKTLSLALVAVSLSLLTACGLSPSSISVAEDLAAYAAAHDGNLPSTWEALATWSRTVDSSFTFKDARALRGYRLNATKVFDTTEPIPPYIVPTSGERDGFCMATAKELHVRLLLDQANRANAKR